MQPERYLPIAPLSNAQRLAMAEAFLFGLPAPFAHTALSQALAGRKALRTFVHALEQWPALQQAWADYQAAQVHDLALEWLEDNGLEAVVRRG